MVDRRAGSKLAPRSPYLDTCVVGGAENETFSMTARRGPDFSLEQAVTDPGFYPRQSDVPALLDLVAMASSAADAAKKALVRFGPDAAKAAMAKTNEADAKSRARLVPLVGRFAAERTSDELTDFLVGRLADEDAAVRRAAANALSKQRTPPVAAALATALETETDASAKRALASALGKTGGVDAAASLDKLETQGDELLARMTAKASLIAQRTAGRDVPSTFDASRKMPRPVPVVLHCRAGLAPILLGEVESQLAPRLVPGSLKADRVLATLVGAPERLFRARTMFGFGFPLPPEPVDASGDVAAALTRALSSPTALGIFEAFTQGPVRFRIDWADGGKHRAVTWRAAEQVSATSASIINDPTSSTWDAIVSTSNDSKSVDVELRPRFDDPRFTYRQCDVPAASHPTIAAALVRVAGVRPDDIVWDPFVGSGMELCERKMAGSYARLIGTDRDQAALDAAKRNLDSAGATQVDLVCADALTFVPRGPRAPTLVITNPPMGRRVLRGEDLHSFLDRFLAHAAAVLAPGGRISWITPVPTQSTRVANHLGLERLMSAKIDMGGFDAEMQLLRVPDRGLKTRGRTGR
jgi:predicted RNA methylase